MNISDDKRCDIKLKEYEQNMNTYRYLAEVNVKYVMFFLIVVSFALKIYVDASERIFSLLLFIVIIGVYVAWAVFKLYKRMSGLSVTINKLTSELGMERQNFKPFLDFLKITFLLISFGISQFSR